MSGEQLPLVLPTTPARKRARPAFQPAPELPVARVAVDVSLAHLDRPFDYLVSAADHERAQPGVRVRVRFAGALHDGFLLERVGASDHHRPRPLERVVSDVAVLTPEIAALARDVADRQGGTLADVLRLAVPPRHAAAERPAPAGPGTEPVALPSPQPAVWARYRGGEVLLSRLGAGDPVRAVLAALPGDGLPALATAAAATAAAGRGAVLVVADHRDLAQTEAALAELLPAGAWVALSADAGPAERYRRFLAVLRGQVRVVVGTRAAAFAPVADLGLAAIWDDGDDLHAEPRAPYPHVREVLGRRAHLAGASLLLAGHAVTAEAARLVQTGWARPIRPDRAAVRAGTPRITVGGEATDADPLAQGARLPQAAWRAARDGLANGPVLVQVPRAGYLPAVACADCGALARCPDCTGPLRLTRAEATGECTRCGRLAAGWRCADCGSAALRAVRIGSRRTAEELGRAFPGVSVRHSGGDHVLARVGSAPALVVATPGAEPVAECGYAAALLLDGDGMLHRPELRAAEEALRRWLNAAALVRPAGDGGRVIIVADSGASVVQALIRWDPFGAADRELSDRASAGMPPAVRAAVLTAAEPTLTQALAALPAGAVVLGPVPEPAPTGRSGPLGATGSPVDGGEAPRQRAVITVAWSQSAALAAAVHAAAATASAAKAAPLHAVLDPVGWL